MPSPAVKPETPPEGMVDRQEGWGTFGSVKGYPEYRDTGIWPEVPVRDEFDPWPPETSDGYWSHEG